MQSGFVQLLSCGDNPDRLLARQKPTPPYRTQSRCQWLHVASDRLKGTSDVASQIATGLDSLKFLQPVVCQHFHFLPANSTRFRPPHSL